MSSLIFLFIVHASAFKKSADKSFWFNHVSNNDKFGENLNLLGDKIEFL